MSIKVKDFKWEKGKNDLEYIALLEKNLDAMADKFKECAKVAKEQYNKGRESAFKEIAYSDDVPKEPFEELAYEKGKADGRAEAYEHCYDAITYADTANECRQIIYDLF